jgi:CHAT domain-containing protein
MCKSEFISVCKNRLLDLTLLAGSAFVFILLFKCATPTVLVNQEQKQGDNYFNHYNYDEAAKHYILMIDASKKLGIYRNFQMEADAQRKVANCYEMTGRYEIALMHIKEAISLDSLNKNLLGWIEDYRQMGKILVYSGSYQEGIKSLEKALAKSEGMDQSIKNINKITIADTYLAIGQLYSVTGKTNDSQTFTNKALTLFEQADDKLGRMESFLALGSTYSDIGDINAARNFTQQSLKLANELGMGTARQYHLLASMSSAGGEYEDALRYQERAIEDAKKVRIVSQIVWTTIGLGDIYRDLGDFKKAQRLYKQAQAIKDTSSMKAASVNASLNLRLGNLMSANQYFASEGSFTGEGISSLRISEMMIKNGKTDSAMIFLNDGAKMFQISKNRQGLSNVQLLKGSLLVDMKEFDRALPLLDSATLSLEFPETVWQAYFHLGRLYEGLGQDGKAIDSYRSSISVIEKIRGNLTVDEFKSIFFENKRDVYDRLMRLLLKENKNLEAFQVSEQARARAFYDIMATKRINYKGSLPGDLIMEEQEKRMEVQKLYLILQKGVSASKESDSRKVDLRQIRTSLSQKQLEYEDILEKIKLNSPSYSSLISAQPLNLYDVQSVLDKKTGLISYWISNNELILWLITSTNVKERSVKVEKSEIVTLVEQARNAIQSNSQQQITSNLSKLYSLLIAPLESEISGFSNLVIIPNSGLHFLPFQALIDEKGKFLVERFNFIYAPSASVYSLCKKRETPTGSSFMGMALGDISVGSNVGLPGTEDELKKILPLFTNKISAFGKDCTESFVRQNAGKYNYLHFATHGVYNYKQPLYSCLLFPPADNDDGRLNVYEVFELNLNSKLVTLSACETGLGNITQGDEITGLSRAFLFAGSSAVIVSLWSVADYPTALLMANFYKYIQSHPLQEALTLAQRDVIKSFPQPSYWSPFILIGNGMVSGI